MAFLDFGKPKEQRTQLVLYDDRSFEFRKLPVEDGALVIKRGERIEAAWPLFNGLSLNFDGYKNISADGVTLAHNRDIIFDPFNKIGVTDKPAKGSALIKEWIKKQATGSVYRVQNKAKAITKLEKMAVYLLIPTVILAVTIALKVLVVK